MRARSEDRRALKGLLRISREQIDAIKARLDLATVVSERGIELERRGRHLFALCPLHREDTPSFVITESKGLFHCFGCGAGGDVIGFVVKHDGVSFPEALRMLAARAGVPLAEEAQREPADACGRTSPWQ
jgi:DNA primase